MNEQIGIQSEGQSSQSVKKMALRALSDIGKSKDILIADIGAGKGELTDILIHFAECVVMVDFFEPEIRNSKVKFVKANLNEEWSIENYLFDIVFSLEVIEHLENPRHFIRQIKKCLKSDGYGFVSMPNNLNFFSKLNFLLSNEHRFFKDLSYPAHITCLFKKDMERILEECGFEIIKIYYNYEDVIPLLGKTIKVPFKGFSNSVGFLFKLKA